MDNADMENKEESYKIWCRKVLFTVQLAVLVSMLITSIVNIIMKTGNLSLWTALLGSSLGFILPTPKFTPTTKPMLSMTPQSSVGNSVPSSILS